jgi:uncharacterized membrane protein YdcZ (DUF606 family)
MSSKTIGLFLIIAGALMIIYTGFNYVTTERVVDLGVLKINQEKIHPVSWSPFVGVALILGGILIIVRDRKNASQS